MGDDFRWLTTAEQRAWRAYISATQGLFDHLERDLHRRAGLSQADYEILVRLSEAPGRRLRMSDLSSETLFSRSRVSHAVKRLAELGWIVRKGCPTDRRGAFAALTDEGFAALADAAPGHADLVRRLVFEELTPDELDGFARACAKIAEAVAPSREHTGVGRGCDGSHEEMTP